MFERAAIELGGAVVSRCFGFSGSIGFLRSAACALGGGGPCGPSVWAERRKGGLGVVLFRQVWDFYFLRLGRRDVRLELFGGLCGSTGAGSGFGGSGVTIGVGGVRPGVSSTGVGVSGVGTGWASVICGPGATSCGGAGGATARGARSIMTAGGGASGVASALRQLRAAEAAVKWTAATTIAAVLQRSPASAACLGTGARSSLSRPRRPIRRARRRALAGCARLTGVLQSDQRDLQVAGVAEEVHHAHQFAVSNGAIGAQKMRCSRSWPVC